MEKERVKGSNSYFEICSNENKTTKKYTKILDVIESSLYNFLRRWDLGLGTLNPTGGYMVSSVALIIHGQHIIKKLSL